MRNREWPEKLLLALLGLLMLVALAQIILK
jgi:hypothetical protein